MRLTLITLLLLVLGGSEPRNTVWPDGDGPASDRPGVSSTEPAGFNSRDNLITSESLGSDGSDASHKRVPRGAKATSAKKRDQQTPFSHGYPRPYGPDEYFTTPTAVRLSNATYNHDDESGITFGEDGAWNQNATERGTTRIHNPLYPLTDSSYSAYAVVFLSLIVFSVGIVGNLAVMCIVWNNYYMKSAWNCILASLAFWDFMVLFFCLPVVIFNELTNKRLLGDFSCRVVPYMEVTSLGVSTFSLCALSIDRFQATASGQSKPRAAVEPCRSILAKLGVVWIGSMVLAAPELLLWQLSQEASPVPGGLADTCTMKPCPGLPESLYSLVLTYHDARMWWCFGCYFCLPVLFTLACQLGTRHVGVSGRRAPPQKQAHGRDRERQLNGAVLALAVVYAVCTLPENASNMALAYASGPASPSTAALLRLVNQFFLFFKCSVTPVLLLCLCKALGQAFVDCCCCCCECGPGPPPGSLAQGKLKGPLDTAPSIFFDKAKDSSSILAIGTTC